MVQGDNDSDDFVSSLMLSLYLFHRQSLTTSLVIFRDGCIVTMPRTRRGLRITRLGVGGRLKKAARKRDSGYLRHMTSDSEA